MGGLRKNLVTACFVEKYSVMMQFSISLRGRPISLDERGQRPGIPTFYQPKVSTQSSPRCNSAEQ
jgi:hypothetical protein